MEGHKTHANDEDCKCSGCTLRFHCFTEERVFSDSLVQGLFEALMAKGRTKEEAIDEVATELRGMIGGYSKPYVSDWLPCVDNNNDIKVTWGTTTNPIVDNNGTIMGKLPDTSNICWTLRSGEEVNWNADAREIVRLHNSAKGSCGNNS